MITGALKVLPDVLSVFKKTPKPKPVTTTRTETKEEWPWWAIPALGGVAVIGVALIYLGSSK
jgi:hypothetical protein